MAKSAFPNIETEKMIASDRFITFNQPSIDKAGHDAVSSVMASGRISANGQYFKKCQQWFANYHQTPHVSLTTSCTASLEVSALLLNINVGDEVILPSFTFVTTANAFVLRGAVPVFVDVSPDSMNIDVDKIEAAITPKTKAIIPVHYAGVACDMDRIMAIAKNCNIAVVEDAAQAILSEYKGQPLGTFGDFGCFSFHETKNLTCGEGGALMVNQQHYVDRAHILLEKGTDRRRFLEGQVDKYTWQDIGSSFLLSEINAALLFTQLQAGNVLIKKRYQLCATYQKILTPLANAGKIILPYSGKLPALSSLVSGIKNSAPISTNAHIFFFFTRSAEERSELLRYLNQRSIGAIFHYVPLHSSIAGLKFGRTHGSMDVTDHQSACLTRLPLHAGMTEADVTMVCNAIAEFYA